MNQPSPPSAASSFLERTLSRVRGAWSEISTNLRGGEALHISADPSDKELDKLDQHIQQALSARSGEVSARNTAARIGHAYMGLNSQGREKFFRLLAQRYDVNENDVKTAIQNYQNNQEPQQQAKLGHKLRNALLAPRVKLLTLFNALPEGIKFLVDMRAELMALGSDKNPELRKVELDLKHLLSSWFDIGFLQLRQITWDSPASILEKLIEYEAVHEVSSWEDLKNRLADDRRLFAFFHPNMPKEPLIFIHVALLESMADNVQKLLDPNAPMVDNENANTAIFYSISNAQQGLAGISFGNFLIKRVVAEVKKELPQLKQFATLSPIPGFRKWLEQKLEQHASANTSAISEDEKNAIEQLMSQLKPQATSPEQLLALLKSNEWQQNDICCESMKPAMKRLCAIYLASQHPHKPRAQDPVAHFHSGNGAIVKQINWMGDSSTKGLKQSYGLMVNYLYDLNTIDQHSEDYANRHCPSLAHEVRQLISDKNEWA